jgi:hypothetical protein
MSDAAKRDVARATDGREKFEHAYELRGGLCRLRAHNLEKRDKNTTTAKQPGDD